MASTDTTECFGQPIEARHLEPMARRIASGIADGNPARWAGFVWYQPQGLFQQNLLHRVADDSRVACHRAA